MPNEWTFTADVAKWIEQVLQERFDLPFGRAEVEESRKGARKRRDLTIYDRTGEPVITGEMKMPDSADGRSPFQESLVLDAHSKANAIGVEYFFTWNVNRCVIWRTFERGKPITQRYLEHHPVFADPPLRHSDEVASPRVEEQIKSFLVVLLERLGAIVSGEKPIPDMPLDAKFLLVWEAALEQPVALTLRAISDRYDKQKRFTAHLDKWMREAQGWTISHRDEGVIRENLERAAKFSCYMLATKMIFYKALRRRFPKLRALRIPGEIGTGKELKPYLDERFTDAKRVTHDYETIFDGDFGDDLPFLEDAATASWRDLSQQTDGFDFTQIDYEIIGQIFERMLSSEERHRFGQHYTRSEVVDLINAFCIRKADAVVLDPACGGGTFLVRAYGRKKALSAGKLEHQELLRQLYGIDISAYPVHLTTMNLVTRDLIGEANYPLVVRDDFFNVHLGEPVFLVPFGGAGGQATMQELSAVDAVVGNPPYIRQEKLSEYYGRAYKGRLQKLVQKDCPGAELSKRSDIHCYFFSHGLSFLKEGGYMGLLTSSTWLDTGYGFALQKFLLDNFAIVAVFESDCEPWFTGARVTTAAVILRHEPDAARRQVNRTRFCLLTKPLNERMEQCTTEEERRGFFDKLRDHVENLKGSTEFTLTPRDGVAISVRQEVLSGMRVRVVRQADLMRLGCQPVRVSDENEEDEIEGNGEWHAEMAPDQLSSEGKYTGSKWGMFLRAPDIFFRLLRKGGSAFVPLSEVADVKFGVKSGCDGFFFPRNVTEEAVGGSENEKEFKDRYGVSRSETDRVRIVQAGDGSIHLIESEYLEPVVFNLMDVPNAQIDPDALKKLVLLVSDPKARLRGTHVLRYIGWGEREGFHERSSLATRPIWYSLSIPRRGDVLWTMAQHYRHVVPLNTPDFICNKNLFNISALDRVDAEVLCGVLNSTVVALNKRFFGRMAGREGVLKTEVVDVKMMLVPDPRLATARVKRRLGKALDSLRKREIGHLVDVDGQGPELSGDLANADRQELDDAVLELLGISDARERGRLQARLYDEMTQLHRFVRVAERRMQKYRSATARGGRPSPKSIADEIWEELESKPEAKTPLDFLEAGETEVVELPAGKAKVVDNLFNPASVLVGEEHIAFGHMARAEFGKALSDRGLSGEVAIPLDPVECRIALERYHGHVAEVREEFKQLAAHYTSDEEMQSRVARELWRKASQGSHG